jgi:hypothetical protein
MYIVFLFNLNHRIKSFPKPKADIKFFPITCTSNFFIQLAKRKEFWVSAYACGFLVPFALLQRLAEFEKGMNSQANNISMFEIAFINNDAKALFRITLEYPSKIGKTPGKTGTMSRKTARSLCLCYRLSHGKYFFFLFSVGIFLRPLMLTSH